MARTSGSSARVGLPPFFVISNAIVWISAVINMGILSYWIHHSRPYLSRHIIYEEVIVRPDPFAVHT